MSEIITCSLTKQIHVLNMY